MKSGAHGASRPEDFVVQGWMDAASLQKPPGMRARQNCEKLLKSKNPWRLARLRRDYAWAVRVARRNGFTEEEVTCLLPPQ